MKISVLFVCLGNICRSPTAEAVFRNIVDEEIAQNKLPFDLEIDSAGTGDWHVGRSPDSRAQSAGKQRGYDLSSLKGRQVNREDFSRFDYILAMDDQNLEDLRRVSDHCEYKGHLGLFLEFGAVSEHQVPDPYYGGASGFDHVLDLIESASRGLLSHILENASKS